MSDSAPFMGFFEWIRERKKAGGMHEPRLKMVWLESLSAVDRRQWNELALPLETPFLEWDWLRLMESSGSTTAETGWIPRHLTAWSGDELVAAAPLYIKLHSAGEFVFDHAWADVAGRLGRSYYPKLVGMSPFTPMIGYRFLMAPAADAGEVGERMAAEIDRFCRRYGLSGCSFNFVDPLWAHAMTGHGFCSWDHQSFAWRNEGYQDFEEYLARFNSNQRRNIRRERIELDRRGITVEMVPGDELPREHYQLMYRFYARTNDQFGPWGCKYLTPEFFNGLPDGFGHRLLFATAFESGRRTAPVAMSLLVTKGTHLYGRYWGSEREVGFLHFNACYYRPIEWAIARGIREFDPGMGGGHKLRRGFEAVANHSLHRFVDPVMQRVMERNIDAINRLQAEDIDALNRERPLSRFSRQASGR
jgi:predicted N-acyltransferase